MERRKQALGRLLWIGINVVTAGIPYLAIASVSAIAAVIYGVVSLFTDLVLDMAPDLWLVDYAYAGAYWVVDVTIWTVMGSTEISAPYLPYKFYDYGNCKVRYW